MTRAFLPDRRVQRPARNRSAMQGRDRASARDVSRPARQCAARSLPNPSVNCSAVPGDVSLEVRADHVARRSGQHRPKMTAALPLTLRQVDRARGDLYAIADDLEFLKEQLAHLPTRAYVSRLALMATGNVWALIGASR